MQYPTLEQVFFSRRNNFDFLRCLLAGLVILTHSFFLLHATVDPLDFLTHGQKSCGKAAIDFFFVISGFLIVGSWLHSKSALEYLKKRVLRIYPGYLASILVAVFVFGLLGASSKAEYLHSISPLHFSLDILRLHKIAAMPTFARNPEPGTLNGSLWSIAVEFECYLLIMVVGWIGFLKQRQWTLALFGISVALYSIVLYPIPGLHHFAAHLPDYMEDKLRVITCFLAGMNLFLYKEKVPLSPRLLWISLAVLVVTAMTTGFVLAMMVCGAYVIFYTAFSPAVKLNDWGKRADLSYGIYLYGWPVQQLLIFYFGRSFNPYALTLIALPLACLCAVMSWFCIERPFLRLKRTADSSQAPQNLQATASQIAPASAEELEASL